MPGRRNIPLPSDAYMLVGTDPEGSRRRSFHSVDETEGADVGLAWWRETGCAASGPGSVHDLYETVDETLEVM